MTQEHRISLRHRTLKSGKISFANDTCIVDCVIRNLSHTGASLVVPMTVGIPNRFTLVDAHGGTRHCAAIAWRKGDRIGVRFTDVADVAPPVRLPRAPRQLKPRCQIHANSQA